MEEALNMPNYAHTWAESDLYIMADEELIETNERTTRRVCPIKKDPDPVLVADRPWEGLGPDGQVASLQDPFYSIILYDPAEDLFKCWYSAYNRFVNRANHPPFANQGSACCYAMSSDGVTWEKPAVRQVLYDGSYENNIVRFMHGSTPDTSVLAEQVWNVIPYGVSESDDRFAASLYAHYDDPIYEKGVAICFSPDGLSWRMHFPPVLPLDGDCHCLSVDAVSKCFIATTRSYQHANLCRRWGRPWKRHIALSRSRDLFNWTPMKTVLEADDKDGEDAQLYLMYIVPYGHAYLGQLLVLNTHEMVLENQLALSRDLDNWQRVGDREPVLTRGSEGDWDSKHVALSNNPPHPEETRMRFWYGGKSAPHYQAGYGALGTGTLRRDGFVCYEAGQEEGILTTVPFRVRGATWIGLNVDASGGEVRVAVVDQAGNPIEGCTHDDCVPIRGDHVRVIVNFKAEPGRFFDRGNFLRFANEVRFRFYVRNAKLYAFKAPNLTPLWPSAEAG